MFANLIGAEWREARETIANVNPSDVDDVVGHYAVAESSDIDEAVSRARDAQRLWFALTPQERSDRLGAVAAELAARHGELARQLSREEGKTLPESSAEVTKAAQLFKYFSGEAVRMWGEHVSSIRAGIDVDVERRPIGVVGLITPWNFPLSIPAWKAGPALACGNAVILKPSELTNASAWSLAEIAARHLPAGVFQLVMGDGRTGGALASHPGVQGISFTGSTQTGRKIAAAAAPGTRLQFEMGGKNPLIVMDDADLGGAVDAAVKGAFYSTGQRCTASSRLIVHEAVATEFTRRLTEALGRLEVGPALDEGTDIGPLVSQAQLDRVQGYLDIGRKEGARLLCGGDLVQARTRGFYMRPALFVDARPEQRINREEIFGPVASVISVSGIDAAIEAANDTEFGLCAGIFTRSLEYARRFRQSIQCGMAMINLPTVGTDYHVPFGGTRASSFGPKELGSAAREFYTTPMTIYTSA
jgi:acyl-CoA reductase-like NAD-dependent aldehyde dehydrogenase